jgi:plastocyanin
VSNLRALLLPIAAVLCALGLASCGSGGDSSSTEAEATTGGKASPASVPTESESGEKVERAVKVDIADFAYDPDPVRVQEGGKVIWMNEDAAPHTATADDGSFDTGTIEEGKIQSETFKQPGTYAYHCEIHPTMHGTVEVIEKE